jgi:hypothetical protein
VARLRGRIPAGAGSAAPRPSTWDRLSREAGVTKGAERWLRGLAARLADLNADLNAHDQDSEARRNAIQYQIDLTSGMQGAIAALIERLEPLRASLPARDFIERFSAVVDEYLEPEAGALEAVKAEIEQLGTVGAVGGSFTLQEFLHAFRANLETASLRERGLGEGVLVADYRMAAGLVFKHVILCGAFEGSFPAGPGSDTLVDDRDWAELRRNFPFVEDAALRVQRAGEAANRAVATAASGHLTWTAPLYESGGTREYYPSPLIVEAASRSNQALRTATLLRRATPAPPKLRRSPSPLAAGLRGHALDTTVTSAPWLPRAVSGRRSPLRRLRWRRTPPAASAFSGATSCA